MKKLLCIIILLGVSQAKPSAGEQISESDWNDLIEGKKIFEAKIKCQALRPESDEETIIHFENPYYKSSKISGVAGAGKSQIAGGIGQHCTLYRIEPKPVYLEVK